MSDEPWQGPDESPAERLARQRREDDEQRAAQHAELRWWRRQMVRLMMSISMGGGFLAGVLFTSLDVSAAWIGPWMLVMIGGLLLVTRRSGG